MVLDSSAMLAYLRSEDGAGLIHDALFDEERDAPIYAHAINLAEVFYDTLKSHDTGTAEIVIATL